MEHDRVVDVQINHRRYGVQPQRHSWEIVVIRESGQREVAERFTREAAAEFANYMRGEGA